jgi:hypothetical protein
VHDRLLDLLAMVPEVLQKSDELDQQPPHLFLPAFVELAEEVRATDAKLHSFFTEYMESSADPLYWEESPRMVTVDDGFESLTVSDGDRDFGLNFKDLETARVLTLYWAMLALSWSGLTDIYSGLTQLLAGNMIPPALTPIVQRLIAEPRDWRDPVSRPLTGTLSLAQLRGWGSAFKRMRKRRPESETSANPFTLLSVGSESMQKCTVLQLRAYGWAGSTADRCTVGHCDQYNAKS